MLVPQSVTAIVKHCDTTPTRYALNCMKLERRGKRSRAIATNGRRLFTAEWQEETSSESSEFETLIPIETVNRLAKLPKPGKKEPRSSHYFTLAEGDELNGTAKFTSCAAGQQSEIVGETSDGRYPNYVNCYPHDDETATVRVDAAYLREALIAMEAIGKENGSTRPSVELTLRAGRDSVSAFICQECGLVYEDAIEGDNCKVCEKPLTQMYRLKSRISPLVVSLCSPSTPQPHELVRASATIMPLRIENNPTNEYVETPAWVPEI